MLVICPQCSTQYNVPLTALPPTGRKTRCASCGHVWLEGAPPAEAITAFAAADALPTPPAAVIAAPENIQPAPKAVKAKPAKKPKPPRKPLPVSAIAAGIAFLFVTFVGAGVIFRESLAKAAPGLTRIYSVVGMPVGNVDDWFERANLKADPFTNGTAQGLKVSGDYKNISPLAQEMPRIRIFWQTSDGKVGALVNAEAADKALEPGKATTFTATLNDLDMSAGGQLGAVLEGGRYDAELTKLTGGTSTTKTASAAKPAAEHEEEEHHTPTAAPAKEH